MTEREKKLLEDGRFANEYAEMIADEVNVKEVTAVIGKDDKGREVKVVYKHDSVGDNHVPLDVYIDGEAQGKHTLAQALFNKVMLERGE